MRRGRGFTLLEVLVALAIFAVVAASVLKQPMGAKHPVMLLVNDFNQIALHHTRFRSALAELLRQAVHLHIQ